MEKELYYYIIYGASRYRFLKTLDQTGEYSSYHLLPWIFIVNSLTSPDSEVILKDVVATLPLKLNNEPSITMFHLWQRALDMQDEQGVIRDERGN